MEVQMKPNSNPVYHQGAHIQNQEVTHGNI